MNTPQTKDTEVEPEVRPDDPAELNEPAFRKTLDNPAFRRRFYEVLDGPVIYDRFHEIFDQLQRRV